VDSNQFGLFENAHKQFLCLPMRLFAPSSQFDDFTPPAFRVCAGLGTVAGSYCNDELSAAKGMVARGHALTQRAQLAIFYFQVDAKRPRYFPITARTGSTSEQLPSLGAFRRLHTVTFSRNKIIVLSRPSETNS
jgi:hypothetical protein